MRLVRLVLLTTIATIWSQTAFAQVPALESRPGAAYTVYMNFSGFSFTGNWGGTLAFPPPAFPGTTPAYDIDGNSSAFSATEIANMRQLWSRAAEAYAPFNINVTTITPPGTPASDFNRQAFFDGQAQLLHMVIGGNGNWFSPANSGVVGVSFIDVASESFPTTLNGQLQNSGAGAGLHTNWTFSSRLAGISPPANLLRDIAGTAIHENGHAFGLNHQSASQTDARGAIMDSFLVNSTRALWASTSFQNDVAILVNNPNMGGYVDSGVGHTRQTATALAMTGTAINFEQAKGVITPNSTNPNPLGEGNYTTDFFSFAVGSEPVNVNVTLRSGRSTLTPGVADPGATLDATLRLLDSNGNLLQISSSGTFTETITANGLTAGTYYFQISSAGADPIYFDMGSYFLTGTITPVPEPGLILLAGVAGLGLRSVVRRRRRTALVKAPDGSNYTMMAGT
jgi:hypothetical protein